MKFEMQIIIMEEKRLNYPRSKNFLIRVCTYSIISEISQQNELYLISVLLFNRMSKMISWQKKIQHYDDLVKVSIWSLYYVILVSLSLGKINGEIQPAKFV